MTVPFRRVQSGDRIIEAVQDSAEACVRSLNASPFADARVVAVTLASGSNTPVAHGLGRLPQDWSVARRHTFAQVIEPVDSHRTRAFITLRADGAFTGSIVVW